MFTILKLVAAGGIGLAVLNPGFQPAADSCQCKANAISFVPHADDCECKGKANAMAFAPHADDCSCKAKASAR
jgi:hypothetical protein